MTRMAFQSTPWNVEAPQMSNYGNAGAAVAGYQGAAFGSLKQNAPDYDALANAGVEAYSKERQQAMASEANVMSTGMQSLGQTASAALYGCRACRCASNMLPHLGKPPLRAYLFQVRS